MKYANIFKQLQKNPEPPTKVDEDDSSISAAFVYFVEDNKDNTPALEFLLEDYTDESLRSMAHLVAPMAHPDFFYLVLGRLMQNFTDLGRPEDYDKLLEEIIKVKDEIMEDDDRPYITPLDLSRRVNE